MEAHNIFTINERDVEAMDEDSLVALINDLIRNRALRIELPLDLVHTTLRINQPDGGVDALTDLRGREEDAMLGQGLLVWQFKKRWSNASTRGGRTKLEEELAKPGVKECFERGGGYVLVLGQGVPPRGPHGVDAKLRLLEQQARAAGCTGTVHLLAADKIAAWATSDPAAVFSLRPEIQTYTRADYELKSPQHGVAFEPDDPRCQIIAKISTEVFGSEPTTSYYRIQGLAGVGKTRLALEVARRAGVESQTLYSGGVPSLELFNWVTVNEQVQVNLIVDECDAPDALRLAQLAYRAGGRLRLITIGPGMTSGEHVLVLEPLRGEAMERVVAGAANLPPEQVRWVAEKTLGYVKLAVLVARAIGQGTRSVTQLGNDWAISELVKNLVVPTDEGRRALQGVALLTRVGFRDEVEGEARVIAAFMGLEWQAMRQALLPAQRQGIVVTRGRFWYVSPELLAVWLAGEVWQGRGDEILGFSASLPSLPSRTAFHERLASLRDIADVERVAAELLGPSGPFLDLNAIASAQNSKVFSVLAKSHPQAALGALQRLIEPSTRDQLLELRAGRREVVWVLERLAEYQDTFFGAARLLLRLAEAENEAYGNNASGVWSELFLTVLAPTEVPALDRLGLIDEAINHHSSSVRALAVVGLSAALRGNESVVLHGPDHEVPRSHWRPTTVRDVQDAKRAALARLSGLLTDPAQEVARQARQALREHLTALVEVGLADDLLPLLKMLPMDEEDDRRRLWQSIQWLLKHGKWPLTVAQKDRFESLAKEIFGDTFGDRIRRYLGEGTPANWPDLKRGEPSLEETWAGLADEALEAEEEFAVLLPWLFSGEAHLLWDFATRFGERDTDLTWLEHLRQAALGAADPRLLSGYLIGRAASKGKAGEEWRDQLLDTWAMDQQHALVVFDATLRGNPGDRAAARLLCLVDRGWVDAKLLAWLQQGTWVHGLSASMLSQIVERLLTEGSTPAITAGLGLFARISERGHSPIPEALRPGAWRLLEHRGGWVNETETYLFWKTVAGGVIDDEPLRLVNLVLTIYREGDPSFQDPRLGLVVRAAAVCQDSVWAAVGATLLSTPRPYRLIWDLRECGFVFSMSSDVVESWLRDWGSHGAKVVAELIKVPDEPSLPQTARYLLQQYRADVGDLLLGNFLGGSWVGSWAAYLQGKIGTIRAWANDPDREVRDWAVEAAQHLESDRATARLREEEEGLE